MQMVCSNFSNSYVVYRYAYWGENAGRKKTSNIRTAFCVKLTEFSTSVSSKCRYILYTPGHLRNIYHFDIKLSDYENKAESSKVWFDEVVEYTENMMEYLTRILSNIHI